MITPVSQNVEEILKGTKHKFSVPNYQRTYDWGKGELQELIDDLIESSHSEDSKLFLGNFIFDISDSSNFKIVDGQQRLTTISILLIAIRQRAKEMNEHQLISELQNLISNYSRIRQKDEVKVEVSENIRLLYDYMANREWDGKFPDEIDGRGVKRQANRIRPLYRYMSEQLSEYGIDELMKFIEALLDAYVVVVRVENTEDVFAVFERTNARGLDLNIADLLKNYIFSYQEDGLEERWLAIVENSSGSLPRMLKYYWNSRNGYVQHSKLYRELKTYVEGIEAQGRSSIDVFTEDLLEFSKYYSAALSLDSQQVQAWCNEFGLEEIASNEDYYAHLTRIFQALRLFRVTQAYPLIFSILRAYSKAEVKSKTLFRVLDTIEKYHFVNNVIAGRVGNEVEKLYTELAPKIFHSENPTDSVVRVEQELQKRRAHRDEFIPIFATDIEYSRKNIGLINYVYDRINNYDRITKRSVKGAQYVYIYSPDKKLSQRNYNIEHLFSQDEAKSLPEDQREYVHDIGNLLVISRHTNSELGNKSPEEKVKMILDDRKHYGNLRYLDDFFESYGDQLSEWDIDKIKSRSKELAEFAFDEVWKF